MLYNVSIISAVTGVILLACYVLILLVVKREMKKSMTNQLATMWEMTNNQPVRVVVDIDKNGRARIKDFQALEESDYIG
jgi:hypothetical protein